MFSELPPTPLTLSPLSFPACAAPPPPPRPFYASPFLHRNQAGGCGLAIDRGERWPERHPHARAGAREGEGVLAQKRKLRGVGAGEGV